MQRKKNKLLELFGRVVEDGEITPEEFLSIQEWFAADPPLKRDEALFCLNAVSEAAFTMLQKKRLEMESHDVAAFMFMLWKSAWEKFCPTVKSSSHRVVFQNRWVPLKSMIIDARHTLDIAVFNFGEDRMARRLQAKAMQGLSIRILTEDRNVHRVPRWLAGLEKVQVKMDEPDRNMHHKFVVADGKRVLTGSMNFTVTGMEDSHEGYIITDHPEIVDPYVSEFDRLWRSGVEPNFKKFGIKPAGIRRRRTLPG
jgi:hypothetical protein